MINFPGYQIKEEIFKGNNSTIFRGTRSSDNTPVIIKFLNKEYPSPEELSRFRREYEIIDRLRGDGIIKVYGLEKYNNSLAIIMEDFGGDSIVRALHDNNLNMKEKLSLAIQMTEALRQIHQQNIMHKDINPSNFVWNRRTNQLKIINFGLSTELTRENPQFLNLNVLEGTLNYISPEQTGRMNRTMDYRTDLYSLGVTFYELFTGQLPFRGDDEVEIVHAHIARNALPPKDVNPELPDVLSDIVMKLLSKTAEERYQNTLGLKKDLEYCLEELGSKGEIRTFKIGQNDISDRFQIPQKLYGREEEIAKLKDAFEDVEKGCMELLLVAGYSGVGKSSLIHEIYKPIVSRKGYFISGKFNKLERNIPYSAILQAFRDLMRQLLAESQHSLENWKERLLEALGPNGQIMVELIPEVEQIIGPQPPVLELNPREAQYRFQMVFREFIRVFTQEDHPLVLFLDDLQWCDLSTLDLLKYFLATSELRYILCIGAYRDNEVMAGHPLQLMREEMQVKFKSESRPFHQLFLKPLEEPVVNQLIADTCRCDPDATKSLTALVFQKTGGNPFFINQLLYSLYRRGLFKFLADEGRWDWNLKEIEDVEISDNVVDFLVQRLGQLPSDTLHILKLASCIGNYFDLKTLSLISKKSFGKTADALWAAIEQDIILPLDSNYRLMRLQKKEVASSGINVGFRFHHDRIQQSIYSLIPESDKPVIHLKIGRILSESFTETARMEHIFDLVNHFNIGRDLIHRKKERIELVNLNLIAGKKAKNSTAYSAAADYFGIGESLLSSEEWASDPNKLFELSLEHAESTFLSGNIKKASDLCERLFGRATNDIDRGSVYILKARILEHQAKTHETINEIRKALQLFDISLPEDPQEIDKEIGEGLEKMQRHLARMPIEELVNIPEMNDENKVMAMKLLFQVIPPAIQIYPPLYILAELIMFDLAISYGTTAVSCKNFVDCGIIQATILGNYEAAYRFGETAFKLISKYRAESLKASVYFVFSRYISHWRVHYRESIEYLYMSRRAGLETGDIEHAAYAYAVMCDDLLYIGRNLEECRQESEMAIAFLSKSQAIAQLMTAQIDHNIILELQTLPHEHTKIDAEEKDNDLFESIKKTNNAMWLHTYGSGKTFANYMLGNMEAAEKWASFTEPFNLAGEGLFKLSDQYLFQSLILTQKWKKAAADEQNKIMETLAKNQEKFKIWSDNCPENFSHKYYLLSAEIAIIQGESLETITDLYKKAIDSIGKDDFIHMRALANELQGAFWLEKEHETIGKAFIQEAYYLYKQWGSLPKLVILEQKYPQCFITHDKRYKETTGTRTTLTDSHSLESSSLDITSIIKSTQAVSSEIKIERLLKTLMKTIIENAGAQHGCLLLKRESDDQLYIEAIKNMDSEEIQVMRLLPLDESRNFCPEIVQYAARTEKSIVLNNACEEGDFQNNAYIAENRIKSVLCSPIIYQKRLKGVIYLENNLSENAFTPERLEVVRILSSQAAISIDNARLYENLEEKVRERTAQLREANDKLKELSLHDPLTKLFNRRYIYEFVSELSTNAIKSKSRLLESDEKRNLSVDDNILGVFLIDLDHFKEVNDTYGHQAGDNALIVISELFKKMIRADDFIVRWGGEEFLIILNNTKTDYLKVFSKKVLHTLKETPIEILDQKRIHKTCSIGCVKLPLGARFPELLNLEQTINVSDFALYTAKEGGRDCAVHIELKDQDNIDEDIKQYLIHLSRDAEINYDYINIEYVK